MPPPSDLSNPAPPRRADWKPRLLLYALGIGLLLWYFHLFVGRYIDDAFITLSYASTLAKSGVWGMAPDLTSNAATSPLNVILLALTIKVFRDPLISLWLFNVLLGVLIYSSLRYFSLRVFGNERFAVLATALLLTNPLLTSTQGLESYLLIALMLLSCQLWDMQSYRLLGIVLGGLFLTRPDALALTAVFLGTLLIRRQWTSALRVSGFFLLPVLPWLSYSWYHLGSLFPDTLLIKLSQGQWGQTAFVGGLPFYWSLFPYIVLLSLASAPALFYLRPVPLSLQRPGGPRQALVFGMASYAVIHFLAYAFLIHVPPYHWYYAAEVGTLVVVTAFVACDASRPYQVTNLIVFSALILISAGVVIGKATHDGTTAISTNLGTPAEYKEIAIWINQHVPDHRIKNSAELGTLQYYTDADMINEFSDRGRVVGLLSTPHTRLAGTLLRWNYRHYSMEVIDRFRYELAVCRVGPIPEMTWITTSRTAGTQHYCVYKDAY